MASLFITLGFIYIFAYSSLYLWAVIQEDIYFDPIVIMPLRSNPEDWISQQGNNDKEKEGQDEDLAEPKRN